MSTAGAAVAAGGESGATRLQDGRLIASVALAYFLVARVSLFFVYEPAGIPAVWLPAGIFLSALLLAPRRVRLYLVGALFLANVAVRGSAGTPIAGGSVYAAALAADALVASWLIQRSRPGPFSFRGVPDLLVFLLVAVVFSNALTSFLAAAAASVAGTAHGYAWLWWAASKGIGPLLATPFIVSWASPRAPWSPERTRSDAAETGALLLSLLLLHYGVLRFPSDNAHSPLLYAYLTFPFLLWAAFR